MPVVQLYRSSPPSGGHPEAHVLAFMGVVLDDANHDMVMNPEATRAMFQIAAEEAPQAVKAGGYLARYADVEVMTTLVSGFGFVICYGKREDFDAVGLFFTGQNQQPLVAIHMDRDLHISSIWYTSSSYREEHQLLSGGRMVRMPRLLPPPLTRSSCLFHTERIRALLPISDLTPGTFKIKLTDDSWKRGLPLRDEVMKGCVSLVGRTVADLLEELTFRMYSPVGLSRLFRRVGSPGFLWEVNSLEEIDHTRDCKLYVY